MTPGKVYGCSKLRELRLQKNLDFRKIKKYTLKQNCQSGNFLLIVLSKRRCRKIEH